VAKVTAVVAAVVKVRQVVVAVVVAAKAAWVAVVAAEKVEAQAVLEEAPADLVAASANISARRRFASFVSRRWTSSTISAPTFFRSLFRSAARFCLVV
jgi:tRNA A37 threonylcarbamoyladenosine synthetase subunit TsaC/SUA5/YrdC